MLPFRYNRRTHVIAFPTALVVHRIVSKSEYSKMRLYIFYVYKSNNVFCLWVTPIWANKKSLVYFSEKHISYILLQHTKRCYSSTPHMWSGDELFIFEIGVGLQL